MSFQNSILSAVCFRQRMNIFGIYKNFIDWKITECMTSYVHKLENFEATALKVHMFNTKRIQADGKRNISFQFSDNNSELLIDFAAILYVPNLFGNFLSFSRLVEQPYYYY